MPTGIFGGTFDPVHIGHLRTALELREFLNLDRMLMMPCGDPPHRDSPMTAAAQRLEMVRLAVRGEHGLIPDDREILRGGSSYMIDTLADLRKELGPDEPLMLCVGMDSLVSLETWLRWRKLLDYCHIIVAARPGWTLPDQGNIAHWLQTHRVTDRERVSTSPSGCVLVAEMTLLPVSATQIRQLLAEGRSIRYLTPDSVVDYIQCNYLYKEKPPS